MSADAASEPAARFAHHSEAEIARLLDFYGIRWEYEPRSFALEWDAEGRMTQAFTPDFYLTDYDLFLEVTTMRPALINRKLRKLRRLRERYPEVNIKLLTQKDLEALLLKWRGSRPAGDEEAIKNLSDGEGPADFTEEDRTTSETSSVSTDLATRQGTVAAR
jgi:hypothetical protein